jgi:hypothetical protein
VTTTGKVDTETWKSQADATRCRVMTQVSRRRTSPDTAEKVQYGTFVFLTVVLPKSAVIAIHDRILYPVKNGQVYDVMAVVPARDGKGPHHLVASCDARA